MHDSFGDDDLTPVTAARPPSAAEVARLVDPVEMVMRKRKPDLPPGRPLLLLRDSEPAKDSVKCALCPSLCFQHPVYARHEGARVCLDCYLSCQHEARKC